MGRRVHGGRVGLVMAHPHVFAMVLAGGEGKRLAPLTADRAKPAVPFGGDYRLVDFVLSNLVNGAYLKIVVRLPSLGRQAAIGERLRHRCRSGVTLK